MSATALKTPPNEVLASLSAELDRLPDDNLVWALAAEHVAKALECEYFSVARPDDAAANERDRLRWRLYSTESAKSVDRKWHEISGRQRKSPALRVQQKKRTIAISDLRNDPEFEDELLRDLQIRMAVLSPILVGQKCEGSIGIYDPAPRDLTESDWLLVESATRLAGLTISRIRTKKTLEQQSRLLASTMDCMPEPMAFLSPEGRVQQVNQGFEKLLGESSFDLLDHLFTDFFDPEDKNSISLCLAVAAGGENAMHIDTTLRPRYGARKDMSWTVTAAGGNGPAETLIAIAEEEIPETKADTSTSREELLADFETPQDRRNSERRNFPYFQSIAPAPDGAMPQLGDFFEVRCKDISPTGFAFFVQRPPKHQRFVVALGPKSSHVFLHAEVRHVQSVILEGRRMYCVGCRYVAREKHWMEES